MTDLKLTELVTKIDQKELVIPDFQRGFKWKQADIKKLLESLLLDFPIGAALFWKTERKALEYRLVEDVDFKDDDDTDCEETNVAHEQNGAKEIDFILDGQQRITSIYKLFPKTVAPTEREIDSNLKGLRFFLDLSRLGLNQDLLRKNGESYYSQLADPDNVAASIIEKRAPDLRKEYRSFTQRVPNRLTDEDVLKICIKRTWLPLTRSFLENKQSHLTKITREVAGNFANVDEDAVHEAISDWVDWFASTFQAVLNRKVLTCLILGNDKPEGLARIFETINSTGMNLSVFDLLVARLGTWYSNGQELNLRKLLTQALSKDILQKFDDHPALGGTASQQVPRILALRAGIDLKKGDILKTPKQKFLDEASTLGNDLKTALETLTNHMGVSDQTYIPAKDAISLIGAVVSEDWERQKDLVIAFLWAICLTVDWDSSTNEKVKQRYHQLKELLSGTYDANLLYEELEREFPTFEELRDSTTKSSIKFRTFMTFNLARGGADWLNKPRTTSEQMEDHHIFPKDWINNNRNSAEDKAVWNSMRDSVLNRIFVSKPANLEAKAKTPPVYLASMTATERRLLQLPESFTNNLTTPITQEVFSQLLKDRYELIRQDFLDYVKLGLSRSQPAETAGKVS